MSKVDHAALARLKATSGDAEKIKEWNQYREDHPEWKPCLSNKDEPADLSGLDLRDINLSGASLWRANLRETDLSDANLSGTGLSGADLSRADLSSANLSGAHLWLVNLREADLASANLSSASLCDADLTAADLRGANLSDTEVRRVHYTRRKMHGKYQGVRVATCYGNALFKRDAQDQDFIDTLDTTLREELGIPGRVKRSLFRAWGRIDYGRSLWRPGFIALGAALLFGVFYWFERYFAWNLLDYTRSAASNLSPFYYSIVTFTTLGFGDVVPRHWIGELVVMGEVILGYLTLGLLVSILANKVARRS